MGAFKYTSKCKAPPGEVTKESAKTRPVLVQHTSGPFGGYFIDNDPAHNVANHQVQEDRVVLVVTESANGSGSALRVEATGENVYGHFVLSGSLDPGTGTLNVTKQYLAETPATGKKGGDSSRKRKAGAAAVPAASKATPKAAGPKPKVGGRLAV